MPFQATTSTQTIALEKPSEILVMSRFKPGTAGLDDQKLPVCCSAQAQGQAQAQHQATPILAPKSQSLSFLAPFLHLSLKSFRLRKKIVEG